MDKTSNINLSMLFDFYELTMGNGYFQNNMGNEISYFDVFYRSVPDKGGFAIDFEGDAEVILIVAVELPFRMDFGKPL